MADYTGTQSANTTFYDTDRFTGNNTLADTYTFTWDVTSGGCQTQVTGAYSITVAGKIVMTGTQAKKIKINSSVANPTLSAWTGFIFNAVDANSTMKHVEIQHAATAINLQTGFTDVFTSNFDKVLITNCRQALNFGVNASVSWGDIEISRCRAHASGTEIVAWNNPSNTKTATFTRFWFHDNTSNAVALIRNQGTNNGLIATTAIFHNLTSVGVSVLRSMDYTFTKLWAWDLCTPFALIGTDTRTHSVAGGIVSSLGNVFTSANLGASSLWQNVDIHGLSCTQKITDGSAPNCDHCYVTGFNANANDAVDTTSGGTADGVSDVTGGVWLSADSVTNPQSSPNYARTITSDSAGTPGADSCDITFTQNFPGDSIVFYGTVSKASAATYAELLAYENNASDYTEVIDYSGRNKLFDQLSARTIPLDNLKPGATVYFRIAAFDRFLKQWVFSASEGSFAVPAAANNAPAMSGFNKGFN